MKLNKITLLLCTVIGTATSNLALATQVIQKQDKVSSVKQLKQELQQLKKNYQEKIAELESRLGDIEENNDETQESVEQLAIDVSQQGNQKAANTFNPGIWMILNGRFVSYNDNFEYTLPGFFLGDEAGPGEQGAQLSESELNMSANVDDKFYAWTTISFGDEGAAVEEAYLQTLNMGNGFNIKFGEFFSDIGYMASKHPHTDDFANRPLPYEAFLGGQYGDAGIQTTWLAPTELYWESGIELYRGDNFPAAGASNSGIGVWTAFSHIGGDIGVSSSWRAGLSYLHADVNDRQSPNGDSFTGKSKLTIADFIYKWAPQGNRVDQEIKLQGEYFFRNEQGIFSDANLTNEALDRNQNGWYLEGVYRFARQWRIGLRTSRLHSDNLPSQFDNSFLDELNHSPTQHSLMLDWTNSEFSRIRLQLDSNNLDGEHNNVYLLQYIASFGAHGAHTF
jgi:hypothetical protein